MKLLPTLKQLEYLTALDSAAHFGQAADICSVTPSTLSAGIKELEDVLGVTLAERTKRSVLMTPIGREIAARARLLLRDAEDLMDFGNRQGRLLSGTLRLGVIPTVSPYLLPRVMPPLRAAYPELQLHLREDTTARLLTRLQRGELDAVVMAFPFETSGFETRIFAEDPLWLAFRQDDPLAARDRLRPGDLGDANVMLLADGHCLREHALAAFGGAAESADTTVEGTSLVTLLQMVENDLGVTLIPKMAVDAGVLRGTGLDARPFAGRRAGRDIGLAWRRTSPRREEFELLGGFLATELGTPVTPRRRRATGKNQKV